MFNDNPDNSFHTPPFQLPFFDSQNLLTDTSHTSKSKSKSPAAIPNNVNPELKTFYSSNQLFQRDLSVLGTLLDNANVYTTRLTAAGLITANTALFQNSLTVLGDASINNLTITRITVLDTIKIDNLRVESDLIVTGNQTNLGNMTITNSILFNNIVNIDNLSILNNFTVSNLTSSGDITIKTDFINTNLTVLGNVTLNHANISTMALLSQLTVTNLESVGNMTIMSTLSTNNVYVEGTGYFQDLEVNNIDFGSNTKLKNVTVLSNIIVYKNQDIDGNLFINGSILANNGLFTNLEKESGITILDTATFTNLQIIGDQYIYNILNVANTAISSNILSSSINVDHLWISNATILDDGFINNGNMTVLSELLIQNEFIGNQIMNTSLQNISQLTTIHLYATNESIFGTEIINGNLQINDPNTTAFLSTNITTSLSILSSLSAPLGFQNSNLIISGSGVGASGSWNFTNLTIGGNLYWNSGIINTYDAIIKNIQTDNATFLSPVIQTSVTIVSNLQINAAAIGGNLINPTALLPNLYTTNMTIMQTTPLVLSQITMLSNLITIHGNEYIAANGNILFDQIATGYINQYIGTNVTAIANNTALLGNITAINNFISGNKLLLGDITALTATANYMQGSSLSNLTNISLPNIQCNNVSVIGGNQTIVSILSLSPSSVAYIPSILAGNMTTVGLLNANTLNVTQLNCDNLTVSNLTITNQANIYRLTAANYTGIVNRMSSVLATNIINYGSDSINNLLVLTSSNYNYMTNAYFNILTNTNLILSNLTSSSSSVLGSNVIIQNSNTSINLSGYTEIITTLAPLINMRLQNTAIITGNIVNGGTLLVQQNMSLLGNKTFIIPQLTNNTAIISQVVVSNLINLNNLNQNTIYGNAFISNSLIVTNVAQISNANIGNLTILSNMVLTTNQISNLSVIGSGSEWIQSNLTVFGTTFANNAQFSNLTAIKYSPITTISVLGNLLEGYGANSYNQKTIQSNLIGQAASAATMSNLFVNYALISNLVYSNLTVAGNLTVLGSEQINNLIISNSVIGTQLKTTGLIVNNIQTGNLLINGTQIVQGNQIITNLTATLANISQILATNLVNTSITIANNATILSHISTNAETIVGNLSIYQTTPISYTNLTATNLTVTSNLFNYSIQTQQSAPYINTLILNTLQLTNSNLTGITNQSLLGTDANGFINIVSGSSNKIWQYNSIAQGLYKTLIDVSNTSSILVNIYPDAFLAQIQNTALSSLAQWRITDQGLTTVGGAQISVLTNFGEVYTSNSTTGTNITALAPTTLNNNIALTLTGGNIVINGNYSSNNMGMYRNRVINGGMTVNQRNATSATISTTGTPLPSTGEYLVDRFAFNRNITSGSVLLSQLTLLSADTPSNYGQTNGLRYSMIASLGLGTTGYFIGNYKMEYDDMSDFNWGTTEGIPITLSFWWRSNLPKNWIGIVNNQAATKYNYLSTYLVTPGTWNYVAVTIPPPPTGSVWLTGGLFIGFNQTGGSSLATTSTTNQWQTTAFYPTITAGETPTSINNYFDITGLQLEKGTIATPFQIKPYSVELEHCLRYYERIRYQTGLYDYLYTNTTGWTIRFVKKKMRNKRSNDASTVTLINNLNVTASGVVSLPPAYSYNYYTIEMTLGGVAAGYYSLLGNSYIDLNNEITYS